MPDLTQLLSGGGGLSISDTALICAYCFTTLILAALAFVTPWGSERVKAWLQPPKLSISYNHAPPLARKSARRPAPDFTKYVFYDFHFIIANDGKTQASNVEAVLDSLWEADANGTFHKVEGFWPVRLRYDGKGTQHVDINPKGKPIYWNLAFLPDRAFLKRRRAEATSDEVPGLGSRGLRLFLDTSERPFHQQNNLRSGTWAVKVVLYSENVKPVEAYFKIVWTGKWRRTEASMLKQIVIQKIGAIRG